MMLNARNTSMHDIKVIKSVEELHNIKTYWKKLQWHPDGDYDRFIDLLRMRNEIKKPYVIAVSTDNEIRTLLAGRLEDMKWPFKYGYKMLFGVDVSSITIGYGGILGILSDESCELVIKELSDALGRKETDIIFIQNIGTDSVLYKKLIDSDRSIGPRITTPIEAHWKIILPEKYNEYYSSLSKSVRHKINNYHNRIKKKYGDNNIQLRCFRNIDELDIVLRDTEAIASKTYHRGLGAGFIANEETKERYMQSMNRGMHRSYILYVDAMPVAFWSGITYESVFHLGTTGYIPEYEEYHVGITSLQMVIDECCRDEKVKEIDFGLGDSQYKQVYCNQKSEEVTVYLFGTTLKVKMITMLSKILMSAEEVSKKYLKKYNLEGKIKRVWREKLASTKKKDV